MDCSRISSSSISSSDSEAGIITNDEDREGKKKQKCSFSYLSFLQEIKFRCRIDKKEKWLISSDVYLTEGDDEQSDWVGDSSLWEEAESTVEEKVATESAFQALLQGSYEHLTDEAKKNYRQRIRDVPNGREIRAGRRHVDNTPGYSIITSANEKVSRFLQDPSQSELKLHPVGQPEREKLRRLANLYSLSLKGDLNCPVLYKTRHTTQAICVDQVTLNRFSDYKRLRKTPPNSPNPDSLILNPEPQVCGPHLGINQNIGSMQNLAQSSHYEWLIPGPETEIQHKTKFYNFEHSKSSWTNTRFFFVRLQSFFHNGD